MQIYHFPGPKNSFPERKYCVLRKKSHEFYQFLHKIAVTNIIILPAFLCTDFHKKNGAF
jgi:hypothetical protein